MWENVGIIRDGRGPRRRAARARRARSASSTRRGLGDQNRAFNLTWHDWLNLKSLVAVSRAITAAAIARKDSRGAHFRSDLPDSGALEASDVHQHSARDGIGHHETGRLHARAARPDAAQACGLKRSTASSPRRGVRVVGYVPDAGHKRLIELCQADKTMRAVVLTTEEEGIGLAAGAWLGGEKSVLLMQSSGVGNVINVLGMVKECRFPLVMIVTMRGEQGEFNPWQVPMGQATRAVLETMGVAVRPAPASRRRVAPHGQRGAAPRLRQLRAVAVLIPQRVIGIKSFQEQTQPMKPASARRGQASCWRTEGAAGRRRPRLDRVGHHRGRRLAAQLPAVGRDGAGGDDGPRARARAAASAACSSSPATARC